MRKAITSLSPPQRLLLVNTRERNGSGRHWRGKRGARGTIIFPLPSLRAPQLYFSQGATVGGLCGGERVLGGWKLVMRRKRRKMATK